MVRPRERYRHGAKRRFSGELIPVFFVGSSSSSFGPNGEQAIVQGNEPSTAPITFNVYNDAERQLAPTASKGFLTWMIATVSDVPSTIDTVFSAQSESITQRSQYSIVSKHVFNNVAYVFCLRSHTVTHNASVTYQYFSFQGFQGQEYGPVGGVNIVSRNVVLDAICDAVVFSCDLQTGQVAAATEMIYQYAANITGRANFVNPIVSYTETKKPVPLAISNLLPNEHPFKTCGASIWSVNPVGQASTTTGSGASYEVTIPSVFNLALEVSRQFSSLLGFNSNSSRRVIQRSGVLEFSDYQAASSSGCSLYQDLELPWADSFADYSPADVLDRDEVFADLSGLSAADEDLFLNPSGDPPATITLGTTSTAGSTVSATYFMGSTPTNQFSFLDGSWDYALNYWIPD